jgi:hypothetical protein
MARGVLQDLLELEVDLLLGQLDRDLGESIRRFGPHQAVQHGLQVRQHRSGAGQCRDLHVVVVQRSLEVATQLVSNPVAAVFDFVRVIPVDHRRPCAVEHHSMPSIFAGRSNLWGRVLGTGNAPGPPPALSNVGTVSAHVSPSAEV